MIAMARGKLDYFYLRRFELILFYSRLTFKVVSYLPLLSKSLDVCGHFCFLIVSFFRFYVVICNVE